MSDEQHRRACWTRFCDAVDAAVLGDYAPAKRLIARPGVSAGELRVLSSAPSKTAVSARSGRTRTSRSSLETLAAWHMQANGIPAPQTEYRFHPTRKFRFDFAWPDQRVALEVMGSVWTAGRHTRGAGYEADCVKANLAQIAGWTVIRCTSAHINDGRMVQWVKEALGMTNAAP